MPKVKVHRLAGSTWNEDYIYKAYEATRDGVHTQQGLAEVLGISTRTLIKWQEKHPALARAIERGLTTKQENPDGSGAAFMDYVHARLPADLKDAWERLVMLDASTEPNAEKQLEALTESMGKRARQHLWVHALVNSNFNESEACRKVNVREGELKCWLRNDPDFPDILATIHKAKKDMIEGSLLRLVKNGEPSVVIFASKTLNRDRGYDPRMTVAHEHSGQVNHLHAGVDLKKALDKLPLADRIRILEALEADEQPQLKQLSAHDIVVNDLEED